MLRKRSRSHQKLQMVSGSESFLGISESSRHKNHRNGSFFGIPSLFVGFSSKGSSDNDSAWSPTSPLDFRLFSGFGNPFSGSSKSVQSVHQMNWDCGKVGLSIVDSLDDHTDASRKVLRSSESKNILFAPGTKFGDPICLNGVQNAHELSSSLKDYPVSPQSFPKTPVKDDEIGADNPTKQDLFCSLSSYGTMGSSGHGSNSSSINIGEGKNIYQLITPKPHILPFPPTLNGSPLNQSLKYFTRQTHLVSDCGNDLSEDYTCVISHGPNPKATHFYGDQTLESWDNIDQNKGFDRKEKRAFTEPADVSPLENFLSFCTSCKKGLQRDQIYMYRGDIAFCSEDCRSKGILADERMDEAAAAAKSVVSDEAPKELEEKKKKKKKKKKGDW